MPDQMIGLPLDSLPAFTIAEDLMGLVWVFVALLTPGLVAGVFWSPFLLSERIRSLLTRLPPRDSWGWTYGLAVVALSFPYVLGTIWALVQTTGDTGAAMANEILDVIVPVSFLYLVGIPVGSIVGLPRLGIDWDQEQYGIGTWAVLVAGSLWYVLLFAVPLFVIVFFLALPL